MVKVTDSLINCVKNKGYMHESGHTLLNITCRNFFLFYIIFNINLLPGSNFHKVVLKK